MGKRLLYRHVRWTLLAVGVVTVGLFAAGWRPLIAPQLADSAGQQSEEHQESASSSQLQMQQGFLVPTLYERTYVSVPAAAFQPKCQDTRYGQYGYGLEMFDEGEECPEARYMGRAYGSPHGTHGFVAGVQLPHDWTVTSMELVYVLDDHRRRSMECALYRCGPHGWHDLMAICYASDSPTDVYGGDRVRWITTDIRGNPLVDNSQYAYYLDWATYPPTINPEQLSTLPICVIIELARQVQPTAP